MPGIDELSFVAKQNGVHQHRDSLTGTSSRSTGVFLSLHKNVFQCELMDRMVAHCADVPGIIKFPWPPLYTYSCGLVSRVQIKDAMIFKN